MAARSAVWCAVMPACTENGLPRLVARGQSEILVQDEAQHCREPTSQAERPRRITMRRISQWPGSRGGRRRRRPQSGADRRTRIGPIRCVFVHGNNAGADWGPLIDPGRRVRPRHRARPPGFRRRRQTRPIGATPSRITPRTSMGCSASSRHGRCIWWRMTSAGRSRSAWAADHLDRTARHHPDKHSAAHQSHRSEDLAQPGPRRALRPAPRTPRRSGR